MEIKEYLDKNLPNLNWNILPQIFEDNGVELTEEIKKYLKETPENTNWNVFNQLISGSSEDDGEVIFSHTFTINALDDTGYGTDSYLINSDLGEQITGPLNFIVNNIKYENIYPAENMYGLSYGSPLLAFSISNELPDGGRYATLFSNIVGTYEVVIKKKVQES